MLFDKKQIMQFLPHRDPFLFLDSIESIEGVDKDLIEGEVIISMKELVGIEVISAFHVSADLSLFAGHFPDNPVLPGVIQVEMMAQTACFGITKMHADPFSINLNVALMGVNDAKFRKPIFPNKDLKIHATCTKARGMIMSYDCQIFNKGILMSQAKIMASVQFY